LNFEFSDDQQELRGHTANFLKASCPVEDVHKSLSGDTDIGKNLWSALSDLGYPGLSVPEAYGGLVWDGWNIAFSLKRLGVSSHPCRLFQICMQD